MTVDFPPDDKHDLRFVKCVMHEAFDGTLCRRSSLDYPQCVPPEHSKNSMNDNNYRKFSMSHRDISWVECSFEFAYVP
jgi:hypothetical protein